MIPFKVASRSKRQTNLFESRFNLLREVNLATSFRFDHANEVLPVFLIEELEFAEDDRVQVWDFLHCDEFGQSADRIASPSSGISFELVGVQERAVRESGQLEESTLR